MPASTPRPTPRRVPRAHSGQALVEYLLVISVVALLCIPAFSFLQTATQQAYDNQQDALNDEPFDNAAASMPTVAVAYSYPADGDDCKNGGWQTFVTPEGTFKNQGDCQSWVVTNGKNAPANTPVPTATALYTPPTATPDPTPTPTTPAYTTPTSKSQCKSGGWKTFNPPTGPFGNQQACKDWVDQH